MKALVQRVSRASVRVEGREVASIQRGILTLLGVESSDDEEACERMIAKILKLRIFEDSAARMNLALRDIQGSHLIVSQFTLLGDLGKGNRPSFLGAGSPEHARRLFEYSVRLSRESGIPTESGVFQAEMSVELVNEGPATFWLQEGPSKAGTRA